MSELTLDRRGAGSTDRWWCVFLSLLDGPCGESARGWEDGEGGTLDAQAPMLAYSGLVLRSMAGRADGVVGVDERRREALVEEEECVRGRCDSVMTAGEPSRKPGGFDGAEEWSRDDVAELGIARPTASS